MSVLYLSFYLFLSLSLYVRLAIQRMEQWMRALTCAGYEYMKLMVAELQRQLNEIEKSKGKDD